MLAGAGRLQPVQQHAHHNDDGVKRREPDSCCQMRLANQSDFSFDIFSERRGFEKKTWEYVLVSEAIL